MLYAKLYSRDLEKFLLFLSEINVITIFFFTFGYQNADVDIQMTVSIMLNTKYYLKSFNNFQVKIVRYRNFQIFESEIVKKYIYTTNF